LFDDGVASGVAEARSAANGAHASTPLKIAPRTARATRGLSARLAR
jgi:hypothetical protein